MNILAFDTCFDACSVCVARAADGPVAELASASEHFEMGHAERLVPMIEEVMERAGMRFADLDRLAVTAGPGTFTGTRIGIAAARGLALATDLPIVSTSSLAVMAEVAADELDLRGAKGGLAVAVDARRGEVYAQLFQSDGRKAASPPMLLSIEEAASLGGDDAVLVVGSGGEAVAETAMRSGRQAAAKLAGLLPSAKGLARIAAHLVPASAPVTPLYLRPPDAKPQGGKSIARAPQ